MYNLNYDEMVEYIQDVIIAYHEKKKIGDEMHLYYRGKLDGIMDILHGKDGGERVKSKVFKEKWIRDDGYNGMNYQQVINKIMEG